MFRGTFFSMIWIPLSRLEPQLSKLKMSRKYLTTTAKRVKCRSRVGEKANLRSLVAVLKEEEGGVSMWMLYLSITSKAMACTPEDLRHYGLRLYLAKSMIQNISLVRIVRPKDVNRECSSRKILTSIASGLRVIIGAQPIYKSVPLLLLVFGGPWITFLRIAGQ